MYICFSPSLSPCRNLSIEGDLLVWETCVNMANASELDNKQKCLSLYRSLRAFHGKTPWITWWRTSVVLDVTSWCRCCSRLNVSGSTNTTKHTFSFRYWPHVWVIAVFVVERIVFPSFFSFNPALTRGPPILSKKRHSRQFKNQQRRKKMIVLTLCWRTLNVVRYRFVFVSRLVFP